MGREEVRCERRCWGLFMGVLPDVLRRDGAAVDLMARLGGCTLGPVRRMACFCFCLGPIVLWSERGIEEELVWGEACRGNGGGEVGGYAIEEAGMGWLRDASRTWWMLVRALLDLRAGLIRGRHNCAWHRA